MKKRILFVLVVIILTLLGGVYWNKKRLSFSSELISVNTSKLLKIINDDNNSNTFVYVGRESCDYCVKFKPQLEKAINNNNKFYVYYYDTDKERDNSNFDDVIAKLNIDKVPMLISLKDINKSFFEKTDEKSITKFMEEISNEN